MTRSILTLGTSPTWSHRDLTTHSEGREDQPRAATLIGGHLH
jgi:hypothetical protein